ncbi:TrkH family potassium uptake protein, partial [Planctomycetota bacterium]
QIRYKNSRLETWLIGLNVSVAVLVVATFVTLFGFAEPLLPERWLYALQVVLLAFFVIEKLLRTFNAESKAEYWHVNWFEVFLLGLLGLVAVSQEGWSEWADSEHVWHFAVGLYLVFQVVIKVCRSTVRLVSLGRNPTRMLIASFLVLIFAGAGLLCLPKAATGVPLSFVDALFTATSATCVTGLVVKDTGSDFTLMGQIVILTLIQLGGLGIVIFGAVFALLLRQALTVRESAAMQDLLSANTLTSIGNIIGFIFAFTLIIEALGTVALLPLWRHDPNWTGTVIQQRWFYSLFHSISAFCNAGFGLYSDSLERFQYRSGVYLVIAPLIVLGGLGFSVLYNLFNVLADRIKRSCIWFRFKHVRLAMALPKRITLQTKIVLSTSLVLILIGTVSIYSFDALTGSPDRLHSASWGAAFFQSVSARTAGFNTVPIDELAPTAQLCLIVLMFIGGSPGSAAGGIKTVTLAVIVMALITTLRKRGEVEVFRRSISTSVVGRALTVTLLFVAATLVATLLLSVTECSHHIPLSDLLFEVTSALATVGLSTGVTATLTALGKIIIILMMLIGRLGPLTLLAAMTFDIKPARYNFPQEPVMVG